MKLLISILLFSFGSAAFGSPCQTFSQSVSQGSPSARLKKFLDVQWKYQMHEYPEQATFAGYPGENDHWSDMSLETIARHKSEVHCQLNALQKIANMGLNKQDRVSLEISKSLLQMALANEKFGAEFMPINHMTGLQNDSLDILSVMPTNTTKELKNVLSRLEKFPVLIEQATVLMREGMKRKITPTRVFLPKVLDQLDSLKPQKVEESAFYKPFTEMATTIPKFEQESLQNQAKETIRLKIYPALEKLKEFMKTEYIPAARETLAWTDLPDGKEWYAHLVKVHTTLNKSPEELHQIGLSEVARITKEMMKIKDQLKFKGSLQDFNHKLLTDSQFYFEKPEDLLRAYRDLTKRIDPELPRVFKTLPRLTYGVREVPAFRAATTSGAEYQGGSLETGKAGWFQANTYDLKSRPKWEMETLALHESVPGHHFQTAIAQELKGTPEFRKFLGFTAYVEGWALYSESLGPELGFFKDPYSLYGHYSDEMLRAVRLVVDTGIHAKGWTRQQALDYFRAQMPVSDIDSQIEIDRYCVWAGQALAYKMGQLKIQELRERAQTQLGDKFDVRLFHDVVLGNGPLPMDILEHIVDDWIKTQKH